jgi:hypothetical protein
VKAAQQQNAALSAELAGLRSEHSRAKNAVIQARAKAQAAGVTLTPAQETQVTSALQSNPSKVESLRKAIADARQLSESIAKLAG